MYICNYKFERHLLSQLGRYTRVKKMAGAIGVLSMIKTCHKLNHLTCSFEEVVLNYYYLKRSAAQG